VTLRNSSPASARCLPATPEALDIVRSQEVHLVLLDMHMPGHRLSGCI
jgi:CheY-like chemotaxis protein